MPPKKKPAEQPEAVEEQSAPVAEAPAEEVAEAQAEAADEAPAEGAAADESAEAEEAVSEDQVDPKLVKINAAVRPMRAADGSDASCDLYKSDKHGNVLVPANEVEGMIEHGFVLVDDED